MSGHSKWSTIKRKKGVNDASRSKLFGRLSKAISVAAKEGVDPGANAKLRVAIEQARAVNMPKDNIERAIDKASRPDSQLSEITYEGFGPGGVGFIVDAVTDNGRRTAQEMKNIFERGGGTLGGPNSVAFNFEPKGYIAFDKKGSGEEELLSLIDLGVEDVEEDSGIIEVYVAPSEIAEIKDKLEKLGYIIKDLELIRRPKIYIHTDSETLKKNIELLDALEENEDVQRVWANVEIPEDLGN